MNLKLLTVLICTLFLLACDKGEAPTEEPVFAPRCRLLSASFHSDNLVPYKGSATFTYNKDYTIAKVESNQDTAFMSFTTVYSKNKVVLKSKYSGDYVYTLDDMGRAISLEQRMPYYWVMERYTYNTDGYLDKVISENEYSKKMYQLNYSSGILVSARGLYTSSDGAYISNLSVDYTYNSEPALNALEWVDPLYNIVAKPLAGLFGKTSKHLMIKSSGLGAIYTHVYTKNGNGQTIRVDSRLQLVDFSSNSPEPYIRSDYSYYHLINYSCD